MMENIEKVKQFQFSGYTCYGKQEEYMNGNLAIQVYEVGTQEPVTMATINTDTVHEPGYAFIANYSENTGLLNVLMEAGIVKEVVGMELSGYVLLPLCEINTDLLLK